MEERRKIGEIKPWETREAAWLQYLEGKLGQLRVARLDTSPWYRDFPKLKVGEVEAGMDHCIGNLEAELGKRRSILSRFKAIKARGRVG